MSDKREIIREINMDWGESQGARAVVHELNSKGSNDDGQTKEAHFCLQCTRVPHATWQVPGARHHTVHSSTIFDDRRLATHFFGEVRGIDLCQNEKRTTGKKEKSLDLLNFMT